MSISFQSFKALFETPCISAQILQFIAYVKKAYNFKCTQQKAPDNSEARRLLQNFGSSVWNLLHVSRLAARIRKWLLIFGKICGPLVEKAFVYLFVSNS
jgi:antitoxin component HigA of HigAB toxin-antitoxin module